VNNAGPLVRAERLKPTRSICGMLLFDRAAVRSTVSDERQA
jgi:hypothetical protein